MKYKLITTEKPSVAKSISEVIGAKNRKDGYYEGNGYRVTWAIGHLIALCEPDEYGDQYARKNFDKALLPINPSNINDGQWKLKVKEDTKQQFNVIKKLINDPDCEYIIDAGDFGAEGLVLQAMIRDMANNTKPVYNFIASSYTKESILHAMDNLQDNNKYKNMIDAQFVKKKGDWQLGMSFSRWYSRPYTDVRPCNVTVGRVQTATLNFIVERYLDNKNFISNPFWQLEVEFDKGFTGLVYHNESNKFDMKNDVETCKALLTPGTSGIIKKVEKTTKSTYSPGLYDIDELEKDGAKLYGYTPKQVLEIAQRLYEVHKVTTYPRTDSRYITDDLVPELKNRIDELSEINPYSALISSEKSNGNFFDGFTERVVNSSKVTDHHAIIITEEFKNLETCKLTEPERNILHLIVTRMLMVLSPKMEVDETSVQVDVNGYLVKNTFKNIANNGYKSVENTLLNKKSGQKDSFLDCGNLAENDTVTVSTTKIHEKMTTAPKLHTNDTLIQAMANASNSIEEDELKVAIKDLGIGTKATRADIIDKLFRYQYVEYTGTSKNKNIIPTEKGIALINAVDEELKTAKLTATWETYFQRIVDGECTVQEFESYIDSSINNIFIRLKNGQGKEVDYTDKPIGYNKTEQDSLGACPCCNNNVINLKGGSGTSAYDYFKCSNKECQFKQYKTSGGIVNITKKNVTAADMKKLLSKNGLTTTCISSKGTQYKANIKVKNQLREYNGKLYPDFIITPIWDK